MKIALTLILYFSFHFFLTGQVTNKKNESIRKDIKRLSKQLTKENMILGKAVGFSGEERPPYKFFKKLVENASKNELIYLTDSKNPVIRGYAFWALVLTDKVLAKRLKDKFAADNEWVVTNLHGCVPVPYTVKDFVDMILLVPEEHMKLYYGD